MAEQDELPIRVANVADPADVAERVEAYRGFVGRVTDAMEQVRAAEYSGADPHGLASAVVDGQGRVVSVRLSRLAVRVSAGELGPAVVAALTAAERGRQDALVRLAARIQPTEDHNGG